MLNNTKSSSRDYLIKQLPSATAFINTDFEIVHASDRWIDHFNFSSPEVFGSTVFDLFGSLSERWRPVLQNCYKGKASGTNTDTYIDHNNEMVWIQWQSLPWYDENENIIGAIIQTEDVTQQVADRQKMEKLGAFLEEKSETAKIGSWELDTEKNLWWCDMTKKIHGVPLNFVPKLDEAIQTYKEGANRETIINALRLAREKGRPWSERLQIITADGKEKWVISSGKPLYRNGMYAGLIGTFQDIDKRVRKDVETKERERLLKTLIDHLPLNVFIKDTKCRKILVNQYELDFYGLKHEDEILGKDDSHFMDADSVKACEEEDYYVLNNAKPILGKENVIVKNNGEVITFLTSKIPMIDDQGQVVGLVGFSLDISNLKFKEEELRNLINVTSLQNKKLVNFAHIVSHNLRSHAANFSMLLEFLLNEKDEKERKKITGMLIESSDGLLETLDNLNEVVAISSNTNLSKKPVFLGEAVNKVVQGLSAFLKTNNARIVNNIPDEIKVNVIPAYLESILMNFITNGIKYKEPSRDPIIELTAKTEDDFMVLGITDNGLGIDLKKHGDKLFGMYKTFHHNKDARGIGLYITKNQIEAMNGKVIAHSTVGKGTTFKIYFNGKN